MSLLVDTFEVHNGKFPVNSKALGKTIKKLRKIGIHKLPVFENIDFVFCVN